MRELSVWQAPVHCAVYTLQVSACTSSDNKKKQINLINNQTSLDQIN